MFECVRAAGSMTSSQVRTPGSVRSAAKTSRSTVTVTLTLTLTYYDDIPTQYTNRVTLTQLSHHIEIFYRLD